MRKQNGMIRLIALIFSVVAVFSLLLSGCGEDEEKAETAAAVTIPPPATTIQQAPECDAGSPSIIPASSGQPRHIYFFRDT